MIIVSVSPPWGAKKAPRMASPSRNITTTHPRMSAPRTVRFSMKCPPPGITQPSITAPITETAGELAPGAVASAIVFKVANGKGRSFVRGKSLLLLRDDLILHLVVDALGKDLLLYQFVLALVRAAGEDRKSV